MEMTTHDFVCEIERALSEMGEAADPAHPLHAAWCRLTQAMYHHNETLEKEMEMKHQDMSEAFL